MAPLMSWNEIRSGLGEALTEYTSNPLIFTIFLKIHHREAKILTTNKEEMFTLYAEKLTGATERRQKPLMTRVWKFIKNGDITPKEQFLSDIVSKMAEVGGAAFLVDQLKPKKKRDKRIHLFMENRKSSGFEDMQDGGLLTEERIETEIEGKTIFSRRISFVGELMVSAMEGIQNKINRRHEYQNSLRHGLFLLLGFAFIYFSVEDSVRKVVKYINKEGLTSTWFDVNIAEQISSDLETLLRYTLIMIMILCLLFVGTAILNKMKKKIEPKVSNLGIVQSSTKNSLGNTFSTLLNRTILVLMLSFLFHAAILSLISKAPRSSFFDIGTPILVCYSMGMLFLLICISFYLVLSGRKLTMIKRLELLPRSL